MARVWCTCPTRCKGGREVAERTRARHEQAIRVKERQELLERAFPEGLASLPDTLRRRRGRPDDDDARGTRSKRIRRDNTQGDDTDTESVRALANVAGL